eukprot:5554429-Prymnesium_polylepis.1
MRARLVRWLQCGATVSAGRGRAEPTVVTNRAHTRRQSASIWHFDMAHERDAARQHAERETWGPSGVRAVIRMYSRTVHKWSSNLSSLAPRHRLILPTLQYQ